MTAHGRVVRRHLRLAPNQTAWVGHWRLSFGTCSAWCLSAETYLRRALKDKTRPPASLGTDRPPPPPPPHHPRQPDTDPTAAVARDTHGCSATGLTYKPPRSRTADPRSRRLGQPTPPPTRPARHGLARLCFVVLLGMLGYRDLLVVGEYATFTRLFAGRCVFRQTLFKVFCRLSILTCRRR